MSRTSTSRHILNSTASVVSSGINPSRFHSFDCTWGEQFGWGWDWGWGRGSVCGSGWGWGWASGWGWGWDWGCGSRFDKASLRSSSMRRVASVGVSLSRTSTSRHILNSTASVVSSGINPSRFHSFDCAWGERCGWEWGCGWDWGWGWRFDKASLRSSSMRRVASVGVSLSRTSTSTSRHILNSTVSVVSSGIKP